ncbi:hypothetical protein DICPUDRAFT_31532 [Dictyostelium purpureum]|uniref:Terpene synthase 8 n=1 Tax=Dictyostelium purpureum TaxID=5786 RepID=TPS8_DICPU|nr:uncharacterized protein DICPUDRAFT_31532 [Dictyostelium purpureum]F0ZHE2.1 RecName: Full=Terpene synthase 8 [Dictyostelium purpureum]AXN72977.1 terpene synthase [Dictyostelium purpureum]EGC36655.1 hypothetical protein DICPUDRAFT_31532 [Dictyostelium purpureum]|eukprot:XP_003286823.1 hypothetical protein DICPUDRAFT_31532 [Dictyostelium purpureum]
MQEEILYKWNYDDFKDKKFKIPKLNMPWDYKFSPYFEEISLENREWIKGTKLISEESDFEKFVYLKTILMNSYLYPHCNKEVFRYINRLNEYIYIVDDFYLEDNVKGQEWVDELFDRNSKFVKENYIGSIMWEIFDDIISVGNDGATDYLIKKTHEWMDSVILFNSKKVNSKFTFEEYTNSRGVDVGMIFGLACTKVHIPPLCDEIENHPVYIDMLANYYNPIHLLINDIYSFNKETKSVRLGNYVKIAAYQLGSIQLAMDHLSKLFDEYIGKIQEKFAELEKIFPNNKDLETHLYIIKTIIACNFNCSTNPNYPRYYGEVLEAELKIINE